MNSELLPEHRLPSEHRRVVGYGGSLELAQDDRLDEASRPEWLPPDRLFEPCELVRFELDHDPPRGGVDLFQRADHRVVAEAGVFSQGAV